MASRRVGSKRLNSRDKDVPAELSKREAQDRSSASPSESPVDSMHVDAPKHQDNARGHRLDKTLRESRGKR